MLFSSTIFMISPLQHFLPCTSTKRFLYIHCICYFSAEKCYTFPVFTEKFCELLMEELEHFEDSDCPKGRPNTMNNYGVLFIFIWLQLYHYMGLLFSLQLSLCGHIGFCAAMILCPEKGWGIVAPRVFFYMWSDCCSSVTDNKLP